MFTLSLQLPSMGYGFQCYKGSSTIISNKGGSLHCFFMSSQKKSMPKGSIYRSGIFATVTNGNGSVDRVLTLDNELPIGLHAESMPRHVAMIMDGNARWARLKGLPVLEGYELGMKRLKEMVKLSCKWGIQAITFYAFSHENWLRPTEDVNFLMELFTRTLREDMDILKREGIRFCAIGDVSKLPEPLQRKVSEAEETTKNNSRLKVIAALSYSGHSDIVQACQRIAHKVKDGELNPTDINESLFDMELETSWKIDAPSPDLLIRTSGEIRVSNFLLWQLAYTEFFFLGLNWPDFGEA